jgi:hypothetical protein
MIFSFTQKVNLELLHVECKSAALWEKRKHDTLCMRVGE